MTEPHRDQRHPQHMLQLAALSLSALVSCAAPAEPSTRCANDITSVVDLSEGGVLYPDTSILGVEGWVHDPLPYQRGQHPVQRFWRDEETCEWMGGWYGWEAHAPIPPDDALLMDTEQSDTEGRLRVMLVAANTAGGNEDLRTWLETLRPMTSSIQTHYGPSRPDFLDAIASRCLAASEEDTLLLVAAGPGSSAGGGSLVLGSEAISYGALMRHLADVCSQAGLIALVLDSSYVPDLATAWPESGPPLLAWSASDGYIPNAARLSPRSGGLLSSALSLSLSEGVAEQCLTPRQALPWQWWDILSDAASVRRHMMAVRWAALTSGAGDTNEALALNSRQRLAAKTASDIPEQPLTLLGTPPPAPSCASDEACMAEVRECALPTCHEFACIEGRCSRRVALDAACDDGSVCTADDRCDAAGLCRGTPIDCDDGNPCTTDSCLHHVGCAHGPRLGAACDDDDLCSVQDRCLADGTCAGNPVDCADDNPCTDDWCDPIAGCIVEVNHAACDDANPCTSPDYCELGLCRGAPLACFDGDPCTADACDLSTGCANPPLPEGSPCDDSNACTQDERCVGGLCTGEHAQCDDGWACTLDSCVDGECSHLPAPGSCITAAGCIPIGERPEDNPCMVCQATNTLVADPSAEGAPCPDDGIPCTHDRCESGVCMHPNAPGTCHGPTGTCVEVGSQITPCLTCADTGVGAPMPEGTACDDDSSCTLTSGCDGLGACTVTPIPCCPVATNLSCGVAFEGTTSPPASAAVDQWSCLPVPYPAAERAHLFSAPCDGQVIFNLQGQPGQLLFLIRGPPAHAEDPATQCLSGQCDTYTSAGLTQWMFTGQDFMLVVDGAEGSEGDYTLEVICDCPQPAP